MPKLGKPVAFPGVGGVFAGLPARSRRRALWLLGLATAAQLRAFLAFERQMKRTGGPGIIPFELAGSTERARQILKAWGPHGRAAAKNSLRLDYLFPPTYGTLQALACAATAEGMAKRGRNVLAAVGGPIGWAQLSAAGFDYAENTALLLILAGRDRRAPRVARQAAVVKFALISIGQGYILLGLVDTGVATACARCRRPAERPHRGGELRR